jgi:acetyl-CoA carboxylase, biotin carboxylase subunit
MGIQRVLVANRGEIAVRVIRACFETGRESVLAASAADVDSLPARLADRVVCIGPASAAESYLRPELVVAAGLGTGCDAVHPGYGFLSENPRLEELCVQEGLTFIGPRGDSLRRSGDKVSARALAAAAGVPTVPGSGPVTDVAGALDAAERVGWPLLIKAAAGGGGRGMHLVDSPDRLADAVALASREAEAAFGDGTVYLERYVRNGRHIEVQVLGDTHGNAVHLGERDCSYQRRYQKLVEESPAPGLPPEVRAALFADALALVKELDYVGAGTVEFLVDADTGEHFFLEVNARLQVEHPVTELVTGLDLVQLQLHVASGLPLPFGQDDVRFSGHAIECRINAEDPTRGFAPGPGTVRTWVWPQSRDVRIDSHVYPGYRVPPYYDSLLAKVIVRGDTRDDAVGTLARTMARAQVEGVPTTIPLFRDLAAHPDFRRGGCSTKWLEEVFLGGAGR